MLKNLKRFTVLNYQVVLLNSRHHGCRGDGQFNSQAYLKQLSNVCETNSANTFTNEYPFIYDTAADLISVADYLYTRKDVCKSAMAISGVSLGGMHAWFAAAVDERWRAAAPLIGVQSFEYALRHMCYHARVASLQEVFDAAAERMGEVGVTKEVVVKVWNAICPGLVDRFDAKVSLQLLWPRPIFVGNGELDERCPLAGVVQAVEEARRACLDMAGSEGGLELWVYRGVGHATTEEMWRDCMSFFERVLVVEKVSKTDANDVV